MTKPIYCPFVYHHLATTPTGYYIPCCEFKQTLADSAGKPLTVVDYSIEEAFNSEAMNLLRQGFEQGKQHSGCVSCWQKEKAGLESKRTEAYEKGFKLHPDDSDKTVLYSLDLKLGNTCNLKCRSCNSNSSSLWAEEEKKLHKKNKIYNIIDNRYDDDNRIWTQIDPANLDKIKRIEFTGGEPFLVKDHIELLESLAESGHAKHIHIQYNTNGTVMPSARLKAVWQHFKIVEVVFSIDGTGSKFEYLRHPGKFADEFVKTVEYIRSLKNTINLHYDFCYTITIFNILDIVKVISYIKNHWGSESTVLNIAYGPDEFAIRNLPVKIKERIAQAIETDLNNADSAVLNGETKERIRQVVQYMTNSESTYFDNFQQQAYTYYQIFAVDELRNESFKTTFPELYWLMSYIFDNVENNVSEIQTDTIRSFVEKKNLTSGLSVYKYRRG